ncbi:hypothetical protein PENTCL1PPCAC_1097, partial [Pristionchus entomophagus]
AVDAVARGCKENLGTHLKLTNALINDGQSPADSLLCTMNALLQTVVDSNFNRMRSFPAVGRLYEIIGALSPTIEKSAQNLSLLYFARSMAVVMEEAVSRLGGGTQEQSNQSLRIDSRPPIPVAAAANTDKQARTATAATPTSAAAAIPKPAAVAATKPASAAVPSTYHQARRQPARMLDYSSEAITGRINMWSISETVKKQELIDLLKKIDFRSDASE